MKQKVVQIRVSEDEKTAFSRAASISGLSMSSWVRERLRRAAIKELREIGETPLTSTDTIDQTRS